MLIVTTNTIEVKKILRYFGIVSGETMLLAGIYNARHPAAFENKLREAKEILHWKK